MFEQSLYTALMWAVVRNSEASVVFLVNAGANVNAVSKSGTTALLLACANQREAFAEFLLVEGNADETIKKKVSLAELIAIIAIY